MTTSVQIRMTSCVLPVVSSPTSNESESKLPKFRNVCLLEF
jgi:hypothetical protein